ncbi:MAG: ATP-binding protein [Endozoicomonadaceae bacterium]|nr:ATP-binding protein [Endozoicomonadaceae bacterium]
MSTDLFPKVVVTGEAFCNRTQLRKELGEYMLKGRHCWIQAHRRHGKTSLVAQSVKDLIPLHKIAYIRCHLTFSADMSNCVRKLISATESLLFQMLSDSHVDDDLATKLSKFANILDSVFKRIKPTVSIQSNRPVINTTQQYTLEILEDVLFGLNKVAAKFDYRVVILIDEFQEIGKLPEHMQIESTLREAVEDASNVTYIFAGSELTLMQQALSNKKRPLYKHTQPILLERITEESYKKHLEQLALDKWKFPLDANAFNKLMFLTQRHPYYVNWLCDEVWKLSCLPTEDDITECWSKVVYLSQREDMGDVRHFSLNEKKLVIAIAKGINRSLTSSKNLTLMKIAASSVSRAIETLTDKDVIDKAGNEYFIVNPALAAFAIESSS